MDWMRFSISVNLEVSFIVMGDSVDPVRAVSVGGSFGLSGVDVTLV